MAYYRMEELPRAYGAPPLTAAIRSVPADFIVQEILPFEPTGQGEHYLLQIRKTLSSTEAVLKKIARFAQVKNAAVSYAGLKDQRGVCDQWFSVHMPGKIEVDWTGLNAADLLVLQAQRHNKKLRRGALRENRFLLRLRNVRGDFHRAQDRLKCIVRSGVPNYFGEQRFGKFATNVMDAQAMFRGDITVHKPFLRGIYLSAARSFLFNEILAYRLRQHCWQNALPGDVFMLQGSHSIFSAAADADIVRRLAEQDIHVTGPMWGGGESMASGVCAQLEAMCVRDNGALTQGLIDSGMRMERRALRIAVRELRWQRLHNDDCLLSFSLPAGGYATAVLRECVVY